MTEQKQDDQLKPTYNIHMNDSEEWRKRVKHILAGGTT